MTPDTSAVQTESACTCMVALFSKPTRAPWPHFRAPASPLMAVHDIFALPVASGVADTETVVNPLIRACSITAVAGTVFVSYTVTKIFAVPSFVILRSIPSPPSDVAANNTRGMTPITAALCRPMDSFRLKGARTDISIALRRSLAERIQAQTIGSLFGTERTTVVRIYSIATVDVHAKPMWHHKSVIVLFQIVLRLLIDLIALTALAFRQRRATAAEILVLRRQIALYKERGIKPRRIDPATRISLALLSRFFNWRDALAVVRPETMIRWH